jgi:hypothetical protein
MLLESTRGFRSGQQIRCTLTNDLTSNNTYYKYTLEAWHWSTPSQREERNSESDIDEEEIEEVPPLPQFG